MASKHTHFWLMTIQGDARTLGARGTIRPRRGETRALIVERIRQLVEAEQPDAVGGAVIAFDIQRNRL